MSTIVSSSTDQRIPPLRAGDFLTRDEFERRYFAMTEVIRAELVEGVGYMPSPVCNDDHGNPHFNLITWLGIYQFATPGTQGGDNSTCRLDLDNEFQPDAFLRILPELGGQSRTVKGYVEGAPELVAEVAASSVSYDLHAKLNVYRRNGVREYVVWRVWDAAIDWFILRAGQLVRLSPGDEGLHRSEVFPGLWLDSHALLSGNVKRVNEIAQQGIGSNEHDDFVARLQSRKTNAGQA